MPKNRLAKLAAREHQTHTGDTYAAARAATTHKPAPVELPESCPQAWPGGLSDFLWNEIGGADLVECKHPKGHRGKHGNAEKTMSWWGGKLSAIEMRRADLMRSLGLTRVRAIDHPGYDA